MSTSGSHQLHLEGCSTRRRDLKTSMLNRRSCSGRSEQLQAQTTMRAGVRAGVRLCSMVVRAWQVSAGWPTCTSQFLPQVSPRSTGTTDVRQDDGMRGWIFLWRQVRPRMHPRLGQGTPARLFWFMFEQGSGQKEVTQPQKPLFSDRASPIGWPSGECRRCMKLPPDPVMRKRMTVPCADDLNPFRTTVPVARATVIPLLSDCIRRHTGFAPTCQAAEDLVA